MRPTGVAESTGYKGTADLESLAAAYAEVGNFADAASTEKKALVLNKKLQGAAERLKLYEAKKAYQTGLISPRRFPCAGNGLTALVLAAAQPGRATRPAAPASRPFSLSTPFLQSGARERTWTMRKSTRRRA